MGLFDWKKKEAPCCCSGSARDVKAADQALTNSRIKVLGSGCANCHTMEANTKAALAELGMDDAVELISDYAVIASYGVMSTPALVVDNKVLSVGRVLKTDEIKVILEKNRP